MTTDERFVALEERIAQLEIALARKHQPSMRRDKRCGCGGGNILKVAQLGVSNGAHLTLFHGIVFNTTEVEAYVCQACNLIELHGIYVDTLRVDGNRIIAYATDTGQPVEPGAAPYR